MDQTATVCREFHTLDLKCLLSNHEGTLGRIRVLKTLEKCKNSASPYMVFALSQRNCCINDLSLHVVRTELLAHLTISSPGVNLEFGQAF